MDQGIDAELENGGGNPRESPPRHTVPNPLDYLFLMRPMILIPVWTFFLLGAYHGSLVTTAPVPMSRLIAGSLAMTALLGAVYIINQIADRETDLANRKLFLIPFRIVSIRAAWIETAILIAAAFVIGAIFLPPAFSLVMLLGLALGAGYSLEPVRLKRRAVFDVLANMAGNGILNTLAGWTAIGAPLAGWAAAGAPPAGSPLAGWAAAGPTSAEWTMLLPYPLAVASVHLVTTLADIEGDRRSGFTTSGAVLGARRGFIVSTVLMIAAIAAAALIGNRIAFYASLLSLPAFLVPGRLRDESSAASAVLLPAKVATLVFSIIAGILYPLYLPVLAAVILATRRYYRKRFGISYPSLRG